MSGHTPGPWELRPHRDTGLPVDAGAYRDIRGANFEPVLTPVGWEVEGIEIPNEADARLIAAAPDLLEALEALLIEASGASGVFKVNTIWMASDAIRKAGGEL